MSECYIHNTYTGLCLSSLTNTKYEVELEPKKKKNTSNYAVTFNITELIRISWYRGSTVVKVLCYKSESRWFDSRWCHWNFSLT